MLAQRIGLHRIYHCSSDLSCQRFLEIYLIFFATGIFLLKATRFLFDIKSCKFDHLVLGGVLGERKFSTKATAPDQYWNLLKSISQNIDAGEQPPLIGDEKFIHFHQDSPKKIIDWAKAQNLDYKGTLASWIVLSLAKGSLTFYMLGSNFLYVCSLMSAQWLGYCPSGQSMPGAWNGNR